MTGGGDVLLALGVVAALVALLVWTRRRWGEPRLKLVREDGTPADPPTLTAAVPNWQPGDTIHLGRDRTLRVIATRLDEGSDGDPVPVLVVEVA